MKMFCIRPYILGGEDPEKGQIFARQLSSLIFFPKI